MGSKRIQKKINTYRQSKGIRDIIRSNDSLLIRGEPHAVDLLLADINGDYSGAQKDFDDKKFVIQYIDIPFGVHNFIIGTKGVNIKNYQSMEGIKTIFLKDDRLHIEREKDTVDLVMARALNALNLVEMTVVGNMEMQRFKRSSNFFSKLDKVEFLPEKEGSDHYAIKKVGRNNEKEKETRRNIDGYDIFKKCISTLKNKRISMSSRVT